MRSNYELVINKEDPAMSTVVPLRHAEISIGRKPGNTILLDERNVSRYHARLLRGKDAVELEDLSSYNGVLLNGQRLSGRVLLQEGDKIQIGDYRLALRRVAQDVTATYADAVTKSLPSLRNRSTVMIRVSQSQRLSRRFWLILTMAVFGLLGGLLLTQKSPPPQHPKRAAPLSTQPLNVYGKNPQAAQPPSGNRARQTAPTIVQVEPQSEAAKVRKRIVRPRAQDAAELKPTETAKPPVAATLSPLPSQGMAQLEQAQTHYIHGEFTAAVRLARGLTTHPSPDVDQTRAWRLLGAAACRLGDLELANESYRRLDTVSRQFLQYVCQQANVTRSEGHFVLTR